MHVPELAADEIPLFHVVVEYWRVARVGMRLGPTLIEARAHGAGIGHGRLVENTARSSEPSLRHVAEGASLISVHRQRVVVKEQLAEQGDSMKPILCGQSSSS